MEIMNGTDPSHLSASGSSSQPIVLDDLDFENLLDTPPGFKHGIAFPKKTSTTTLPDTDLISEKRDRPGVSSTLSPLTASQDTQQKPTSNFVLHDSHQV
jgi:hypothetical protein